MARKLKSWAEKLEAANWESVNECHTHQEER